MGLQVFAGRTLRLDRARGRNVVGRHRVAEHGQHARATYVVKWRRLSRHSIEKWRSLHVGGGVVPLKEFACRGLQSLPAFIPLKRLLISLFEHLCTNGGIDGVLNLLL